MGKENPILKQDFDQMGYLDQLSHYHGLFYGVFQLGKPYHTEEISTAAVGFNESTGKVEFLINPNFFYRLGEKEQLFVLCHEALHVVLSHIDRTRQFKLHGDLSNIAQDIVINELLVSEFGFDRKLLKFGFKPCFIDTVFDKETIKKENIQPGKSFEYYYDLLIKNQNNLGMDVQTMDMHGQKGQPQPKGQNGTPLQDIPQEVTESIAKSVMSDLSEDEQDSLLESLDDCIKEHDAMRGDMGGGSLFGITLEQKQQNPWEKIVKNKVASLLKKDIRDLESFRVRPRRLTILSEDMFLPEYLEEDKNDNDKFNLVFFLDASGSCIGYKNQFFNLARSIPEDKFNVKLYSFDTRTYELDIKDPHVKGGGGTSFGPLETAVQKAIKEDERFLGKYPDLVFVLTDGMGTKVSPEKPQNWYWLMTGNYHHCIPSGSNIVPLRKFKNKQVEVTVKGSSKMKP